MKFLGFVAFIVVLCFHPIAFLVVSAIIITLTAIVVMCTHDRRA